jgi:hypothetical protein
MNTVYDDATADAYANDDAIAVAVANAYKFDVYDPEDAPPTEETPLHKAIYDMAVTPENLEKITAKYEHMSGAEIAESLNLPLDITAMVSDYRYINQAHPASGNTPLHTAVFACFREEENFGSEFQIYKLCKQLIHYGADLTAENHAGLYPSELADELITFLEGEDNTVNNPYLKYREHVKLKRRISHLFLLRGLLVYYTDIMQRVS